MRALVCTLALACAAAESPKPDVLMVVSDDLNDWIGCLGGHPQVKTPNLDRLAARGMVFANAHCQAPLCNPSRISLMTGLLPSTTGVYALEPKHREVPLLRDRRTLPQMFKEAGWKTYTIGKVYHGALIQSEREWDAVGTITIPDKIPAERVGSVNVVWGPLAGGDDATRDGRIATAAVAYLESLPAAQPAFTAVGFSFPHVPLRVPQAWYELYPPAGLVLPQICPDDRADVPRFAGYLHWLLPEPRLGQLREAQQWEAHVQGYLAAISCMDAQVGRLLDALDRTGRASRTIVVLFSDNGYHLGEKGITGKNTLWERSTRVPLIVSVPGLQPGRCDEPAGLIDLYPTLAELTGLQPAEGQDGHSLVPQLRDPAAARPWPALTIHGRGNITARDRHWRSIRYADGSQELYDHRDDPHEWNNLASRPEHAAILADLARSFPATPAQPVAGSKTRLIDLDPVTHVVSWEGKPIEPEAPWPEVMP